MQTHEISTAFEMGWAELTNGDLLQSAEHTGFAVMVTADKNLTYQQNLSGRRLAIVVLSTNRWIVVKTCGPQISEALNNASPGSFQTLVLAESEADNS